MPERDRDPVGEPLHEIGQRGFEAPVQRGRAQAVDQLPDLGAAGLEVRRERRQQRAGRVVDDGPAHDVGEHPRPGQRGSHAVVQVAAQPAALLLAGQDEPVARPLQVHRAAARLRGQRRLVGQVAQQRRLARREPLARPPGGREQLADRPAVRHHREPRGLARPAPVLGGGRRVAVVGGDPDGGVGHPQPVDDGRGDLRQDGQRVTGRPRPPPDRAHHGVRLVAAPVEQPADRALGQPVRRGEHRGHGGGGQQRDRAAEPGEHPAEHGHRRGVDHHRPRCEHQPDDAAVHVEVEVLEPVEQHRQGQPERQAHRGRHPAVGDVDPVERDGHPEQHEHGQQAGELPALERPGRPPPDDQRREDAERGGGRRDPGEQGDVQEQPDHRPRRLFGVAEQRRRLADRGGHERRRRDPRRPDERGGQRPPPRRRQPPVRHEQQQDRDGAQRRPPGPLAQPGRGNPGRPRDGQGRDARHETGREHEPPDGMAGPAAQHEHPERGEPGRERDGHGRRVRVGSRVAGEDTADPQQDDGEPDRPEDGHGQIGQALVGRPGDSGHEATGRRAQCAMPSLCATRCQ